jgi:hypothetical protein
MKDNRTATLVFSLILILVISSACQPAQPAAPAPPDAVPVAAALQPTATKAPPTATPPPTVTPAPTDVPEPTEIPALNPSPRGYVSMAYDSESDKIILYGGQTESDGQSSNQIIPNDETWAYDVATNTWINMKPASGPPEKAAVDLVYDSESDRVILFGGNWGDSDTWAYDYNTNTWTEMAKGPGNHLGYRMAYDSESDRCILFGGLERPSGVYNDTWAYDFNTDTWTIMEPVTSPAGRNYHGMAYDLKADRIILFGGGNWSKNMADTWAYDYNTNTWTELESVEGAHPRARSYLALVYNIGADRTILFGGDAGGHETWSYDYSTNTWAKLETSKNPVVSRHAMTYSSVDDRVILFGGQIGQNFDYTERTWSYDYPTTTWTNMTRSP